MSDGEKKAKLTIEEKIVEQFPKLPVEKIKKWILEKVVQNAYVIYDSKNDTAFCTRCQKEMSIFDDFDIILKHNEKGCCPLCGADVMFKADGRGRKNLTELTRVLVLQRKGRAIFGEVADIDIVFNDTLIPVIKAWSTAIYKFNSEEQVYLEQCSRYYGDRYVKREKVNLPTVPNNMGYPPKRQNTFVYEENFKNLFDNTDLKYADVNKVYFERALDARELVRYLDLSLKYSSIELLLKSGFSLLVLNKLDGNNYGNAVNFRGKDLRKILRMDKGEIRYFRDKDISSRELETYNIYKKQGARLNIREIEIANDMYEGEIDGFKKKANIEIIKIIKYLVKQNYDEKGERIRHNRFADYRDYIIDCIKLGLDIRKNKIIFPEDFYASHMELTEKVLENKNKGINEMFVRIVENYFSVNNIEKTYSDENFVIRPAMDPKELNEESSQLGHCVKTYVERVARGSSIIMFVRKVNEQNKSYYTLELMDKEIVQCRGKGNCSMTDEVEAFVNKWHKEVVMKKNKKAKPKTEKQRKKLKKIKVKAVA